MKATKQQIYEHYVKNGMPEIYAFIASEEDHVGVITKNPIDTLLGGFIWEYSAFGHDFWWGISEELAYD